METFQGKIKDLSAMGTGVVDHPEGRVFFVRGVWPGDEGIFEVVSRQKTYGIAKVFQLDKFSEDREDNPCVHAGTEEGQCGGCPWLGVKYERQLAYKQKITEFLIHKVFPQFLVKPIWGSPRVFGYRNRAQIKTNGMQAGFVTPGTKALAPIKDCLVLTDKNRDFLKKIISLLPKREWIPKPPYIWNFIEIDEELEFENFELNKRRTFKQGNTEQNKRMQEWLKEKLTLLNKDDEVLELFCGSGNFTQVISEAGFHKITAVEASKAAVAHLEAQNFPNVMGLAADLFYPTHWQEMEAAAKNAEILILDPPREGFPPLGDFLVRFKNLKRILYISCDVSRLSYELSILKKNHWVLKEVQPLDQFPHTPHVELLVELVK